MGICRIQKPTSTKSTHGKLYAQITHNGEKGEKYDFDATKGDLRLHLECEEGDYEGFSIIADVPEELLILINGMQNRINAMQIQIDNLGDAGIIFSSDFIENNPIDPIELEIILDGDGAYLNGSFSSDFIESNPINPIELEVILDGDESYLEGSFSSDFIENNPINPISIGE